MPKKHAILIANTEYRDGKLAGLPHPGLAYAELADALKDPARGAFSQVETLVNANLSHVLNTLDRFFARKPADDILLVYVGAHGFLDAQGELFLALKESDRLRLKSTALMAAVLGMNMDQCPSPHKLLILDCRFHSPYQDGRAGADGPKVDAAKVFAGRGLPKQILLAAGTPGASANKVATPAATSATQKLQIVAPKDFTRALAETLRTPPGTGVRAPFTVEDWWNAAAAELKASKAEPPQRLTVGEPPLTILRGASLPRHEMALSTPGGESVVTMPVLPSEPEGDWSRLSGIFPLEMFAPDLAPPRPGAGAEPPPEDGLEPAAEAEAADTTDAADSADATEVDPARGDRPARDGRGLIAGADLVLRARQEIESATPADLSDPDAGTLESPLSTSPTLELPEAPEPDDGAATGARPGTAGRPDANLFFDLRLPPDLSGNATLAWDRPADVTPPAAPAAGPGSLASHRPPAAPLGPRDTFTGLRARLEAQEEEEKQARLEAEKEEAAQREKLEQWKARWEARTGLKPSGAVEAPGSKAEPSQPGPAAPAPDKPKGYQAKMTALQKTLFVPGPDVDPEGLTPPRPLPEPPAGTGREEPAPMPPGWDGRTTLFVSKDQFLNTGTHKVPTELTPGATLRVSKEDIPGPGTPGAPGFPGTGDGGATIMVSKEEFYGTRTPGAPGSPGTGDGGATIVVSKDDFYGSGAPAGSPPDAASRPSRPIRAEGDGGRSRRTAPRPPKVPGPGRRKALLWALAALAPVGLGLFLVFGAKAGLFRAFGWGDDEPGREAAPPRTEQVTPRRASPAPDPVAEALPPPASDAPVPAAPAAPAAAAPSAPAAAVPKTPAPARVPSAVPAPVVPAARPAAPAGLAKAPVDPLGRSQEKALRPARPAGRTALDAESRARANPRADSLRAARFTRDSLAVFQALARKDSLRAARATRDSLLTARALARKDSLQQLRMIRDLERARKREEDAARNALTRAKADSLQAVKDAAASETLLRRSVNQAFKAKTEEMRGLYNRFALGYPGLKGEVVVSLVVAPSGEIERGLIQNSSTGVGMFDQMVLGNILEWKIRPFKAAGPKAILVAVNFPID